MKTTKKTSALVALMLVASAPVYADGKPQATCPVMAGQAVNPKLYVDSDGYRIYVCCGGCVKAVKADPAKYIAKMKAAGVELEKTPQK
ncbi:MAG: hypothetical protein HOO88_08110 [Kiritimatiellaceae bacterium]|nr:hypothetical protein [Kiritimatiellaceae bacterium]